MFGGPQSKLSNSHNRNSGSHNESGSMKGAPSIKSITSLQRSASSTGSVSSTTAIDPDQLLALCHKINENIKKLDKSIALIQLRFVTLNYVCIEHGFDPWPINCLTELVELCRLSEKLVGQLDELNRKISNDPQSTISFSIGSQQLAYFTSEWYSNLTPKFQQTLDVADRYIGLTAGQNVGLHRARSVLLRGGEHSANRLHKVSSTTSASLRIHEALMRLKQSMGENEHLIASISNNLEYTRATIEAIYSSLQTSKANLEQGEKNAIESIGIVRNSNRTKIILSVVCLVFVVITLILLLRLIGIL